LALCACWKSRSSYRLLSWSRATSRSMARVMRRVMASAYRRRQAQRGPRAGRPRCRVTRAFPPGPGPTKPAARSLACVVSGWCGIGRTAPATGVTQIVLNVPILRSSTRPGAMFAACMSEWQRSWVGTRTGGEARQGARAPGPGAAPRGMPAHAHPHPPQARRRRTSARWTSVSSTVPSMWTSWRR
jgi:hypothetical protein